jgi:hypothetical protein
MKKQAFQEDALLRATIREILYNEQPKIMNEGILSGIGDFLLGIINSVLKLFGVEIKKGETQAYTQIGQAVDGSVVDAGLVDEKVDTLMKGVKDELGGGKVVKLTPPGSTDVINLTGLIWPPDDPAEGVNIEGEWAEGSNAGKPITDPLSSEEVAKFTEADFEISDA